MVVGQIQSNCYILAEDPDALVVDPGAAADYILEKIKENNHELKWIINTHVHYDHIGANADLAKKTGCKIYIHKKDLAGITDADINLSSWFGDLEYDYHVEALEEGPLKLGPLDLEIIHTPGHSAGSICILYNGYLFSGDTLFKSSIGRTDLPTSSYEDMVSSLKKIKRLNANLVVLPGHGEQTTLTEELAANPYLA